MDINEISWQERYRATFIYTLRCKLEDTPGKLGELTTTIGAAGAHLGDIAIVGVEGNNKIRDISIFCSGKKHLDDVLSRIAKLSGVAIISVRDEILETHRRGTINVVSRAPILSLTDLRKVYTPGVAAVCEKVKADPVSAWDYTGIADRVAVVTNGTAVLGLGNIGVMPSLPVMEGKSSIFAEFAGISAFPILVDSEDVDVVVETVARIAGTFGAIQLEDISAPACFAIEEKLQHKLDIPVCHDDQHGTATVLLAALISALRQTGKDPKKCSALILGAGAAGFAITKMLLNFGIGDIVVYDSQGPIYRGRTKQMNPYKQQLAELTNRKNEQGTLAEGFRGKDIFIGVARPHAVCPEMIASMAKDPLVFPLSNPIGEITVDEARQAGAAIAADGRTINNALAYPGLFRGALDVRATDITPAMLIAAARKLADLAPDDKLLPSMLDHNVHRSVADAVAGAWKSK